jgi:hypothetical protein
MQAKADKILEDLKSKLQPFSKDCNFSTKAGNQKLND